MQNEPLANRARPVQDKALSADWHRKTARELLARIAGEPQHADRLTQMAANQNLLAQIKEQRLVQKKLK